MERTQIFDLMGELKLYGMKAAFDEIMATAVKRQHEPQRIVGDLLNAEINEPGRSNTSSPLPSCRSPRTSPTSSLTARRSIRLSSMISLAAASSPNNATSCWLAAPVQAKHTWPLPSPEVASAMALEDASTTSSTSSTGSRPKPATVGRDGSPSI